MNAKIVYDENSTVVLQTVGQIEYEDRGELNALLEKQLELGSKAVLLDFSSMNYIGSAGIGVIAQFHKRFSSGGANLYILNAQTGIRQIFNNIGLSSRLNFIEGSYEDVIKEVS